MKIGVVSPFQPREVADLLDEPSRARIAGIRGVTATPVTPLVRAWLGRGHTVSVFCLDPSVSKVQTLRGERLTLQMIPKRRARSYLLDCYRQECRLIRELVRQDRPDVLTAQWTYDHALGALQSGIPAVVTCHDTPWRYAWTAKSWFMTYHIAVAWRVIRRANRLVCVSPYTAQHIQKYFRPRGPVDIVPNGVSAEVFQRGDRRFQAPTKPERALTLCNVGGWGPIKNVATLLRSFALVHAQKPGARLVLFGQELGLSQSADIWARRHDLHQGVEFRGSVPYRQVLDFLETEAGLMVHPSLVETHGMVLVEAMACGVPVIGGNPSGAVAWTLEDGRSGYLSDVRQPRILADTILRALNAPDGNRALVEHAWASSRKRFNEEQAVNGNEMILKQLCAAPAQT
jgi:glycosyltransferase involved in cell wall biosynthesis